MIFMLFNACPTERNGRSEREGCGSGALGNGKRIYQLLLFFG